MKKLLLALIASITFTSAIAQTNLVTSSNINGVVTTFELKKANVNTGIFSKSITPYQQCVMNCLAIYGTWNDRGLDRCLAKCGV